MAGVSCTFPPGTGLRTGYPYLFNKMSCKQETGRWASKQGVRSANVYRIQRVGGLRATPNTVLFNSLYARRPSLMTQPRTNNQVHQANTSLPQTTVAVKTPTSFKKSPISILFHCCPAHHRNFIQAQILNYFFQKCKYAIAIEYILIAGRSLVEIAKNTNGAGLLLSPQSWKAWSDKLREIADAATADDEWDLKVNATTAHATTAHARTVELWPEFFYFFFEEWEE
ncbi:hypothetical protein B0H67DRAFT_557353 [Lasiosphaeris hirsuta]|uniref:Uncharacterized protein n=1 Tax=Lasiosphaeris hirsuta TaxID=260670 RepID=A0AA39ZW13_9PEZI|nr:hypothetical protein B0H67DRAFT_557353 [Lasiosphaeris hirsuta]